MHKTETPGIVQNLVLKNFFVNKIQNFQTSAKVERKEM